MIARLFSAAMALLVGLLAVLLLDLALGGPGALAQERKNCPSGFFWERLSGQCCVQDRATLPSNGKIGYTGNSLCLEGYVGVYERRPTTDGEGPPGCPNDTSFAFLTACLTPEEYAAMEAAGELPGQTPAAPGTTTGEGGFSGTAGDAAETLYDGGGGPSKGDLALVGIGCGTGFGLWGWGTWVLGAGVGGPPGAPGAMQMPSPDEMIADAKKRLERLRRRRDDAYAQWRATKDVLSLYEKHHFWGQTGHYARLTAFALFAAVGAYLLIPAEGLAGAYFAVKGAKGLTLIKIGAGGSAGVLTGYSVAQPPADVSEAARWIEKIRPMEEQAANKYLSLDAQIKSEEHQLVQLEGQKLFSKYVK